MINAVLWQHVLSQHCIKQNDVILLMISTKIVTLARFSEKVPNDGRRRPKHVGATV